MTDLIHIAVSKGAKLYANISGGKDGQAMSKVLHSNGFAIEKFLHCDLGRIEWPESKMMCERQAKELGSPLRLVTRNDGMDMIDLWERRMQVVEGQDKPGWSSAAARYCTSGMKIGPTNNFYRAAGFDFIISCEGIRSAESAKRATKEPLQIRQSVSSTFYAGMTPAQAIANFQVGKRLVLTWYPIFGFTLADVLATYGNTIADMEAARTIYATTGMVPKFWKFHPAYAYGNTRVSCMFCVLGCAGDLANAAAHAPEVLAKLISMEKKSGFTFKHKFSLTQLNVNND